MTGIEEYRLKYITHGLRESHKRFHEYLNTKEKQKSAPITAALSEVLMWISISDEWHYKINKDGDYKKSRSENLGGRYVMGLRYAFNSIKHVMSFIEIIGTTGMKEFLMKDHYIEDYTTDVIWLDADPLIEYDEEFKYQRANYIKHIQGKKVVETIDAACRFLNAEYDKINRS